MTAVYLVILFIAKVLDNTLGTAKTILVQRNRCVLAGVALGLSNFIYLSITKDIVTSDSSLALATVSIADSYTLDWSKKSITITAYAETKAQSKLIDDYIANSSLKFKRVISRS